MVTKSNHPYRIFAITLIVFWPASQVLALNTTAINLCQVQLHSCTTENGPAASQNCTQLFEDCISIAASPQVPEPESCAIARAKWENFAVGWKTATTVFLITAFGLPTFLKAAATGLTKLSEWHNERNCRGAIGKIALWLFDHDQDKRITGNELLAPQFAIFIGSIIFPYFDWKDANIQQAKCDFDKSQSN